MYTQLLNMTPQAIYEFTQEYCKGRKLTMPNPQEAILWMQTEVGETIEALLAMDNKWVRNNPQDHKTTTENDVLNELGDVIFMAIVTGMVLCDKNALQFMLRKMIDKLHPDDERRYNDQN